MSEQIEAIHLVALAIDARRKKGKPGHAEALQLSELAKEIWLKRLNSKIHNRCHHCGEEL